MKRIGLVVLASFVGVAAAQSIRGAMLVAADGQFLGTCDGEYGITSFDNDYSLYGGKFSSASIFNDYGTYGGKYSSYSPYSAYGDPPYLLASDYQLLQLFTSASYRPDSDMARALSRSGAARVTVSRAYPNSIDPDALKAACRNP